MVMCTGLVYKVRFRGPGHKVRCKGPQALGLGAHVMVSCTRSPESDQTVISKCTFQNSPHVNHFSSQSIHKHKNNNTQTGWAVRATAHLKSKQPLCKWHRYSSKANNTKVKRNQQGEELWTLDFFNSCFRQTDPDALNAKRIQACFFCFFLSLSLSLFFLLFLLLFF